MSDTICDQVTSALRLSLTPDETNQNSFFVASGLYSLGKSVFLSNIDFEVSGDYQNNVLDGLKSKYVVLRPTKPVSERKLRKDCSSASQTPDTNKKPLEKLQMGWQKPWTVGAGMANTRNTCYLNATLQALFHVPAFVNWIVTEKGHAEKCNKQETCVICGMRATLMATQNSGRTGTYINPEQVSSKLRLICRHLTPGRQEDAHEFLRYLLEAMENCYLSRFINADNIGTHTKESTPINQIFGGTLRTIVRCLACQNQSTTYENFQDLLLDVEKENTLDESLQSFFSRELLQDIGYKCETCQKTVSATKEFYIERAPKVLCITLKRFSFGHKVDKHVLFKNKINLNQYMYNNNNQRLTYKLMSTITHFGDSVSHGHYTAVGQACDLRYYNFDDQQVRPIPMKDLLKTRPYILFFGKEEQSKVVVG